jgi:hypothetical protein
VNERTARALVYARSEGACERCGHFPGMSWHHRKNKGQGGLWAPSNGLHLCGDGARMCHGWITGHPKASRDLGWAVSAYADPLVTPVLLAAHGWVLLDDAGGITAC